jgi:hypothetical protein
VETPIAKVVLGRGHLPGFDHIAVEPHNKPSTAELAPTPTVCYSWTFVTNEVVHRVTAISDLPRAVGSSYGS